MFSTFTPRTAEAHEILNFSLIFNPVAELWPRRCSQTKFNFLLPYIRFWIDSLYFEKEIDRSRPLHLRHCQISASAQALQFFLRR